MNESFKIGIYHGVYCHPDRRGFQYSCRITDPNTGVVIEEFFATEREAAIFWNTKTAELVVEFNENHKEKRHVTLNKINELSTDVDFNGGE